MSKYIDTEKLKAELKKLSESDNPIEYSSMEKSAYNCALYDVEYLITSLQQEQPQVADASKMEQSEVDLEKEFQEYWYLHHYDQRLRRQVVDGHGKAVLKNVARHFYELRNRALEEAARNVYESWKGGTMDVFLRDMVELGKALNARKEE